MRWLGIFLVLGLAQAQDVAGTWRGAVEIPGAPLEVTVVLEQANGGWQGSIDIPAQNSFGLALERVLVERGAVTFSIAGVPGKPTFDGLAEPDVIGGVFTQSGERFDFRLDRFTGLSEEEVVELGQRYTDLFYRGDAALLRSYFSEVMRDALDEKALKDFGAQIVEDAGKEQQVSDERVTLEDGYTVYERSATFDKDNLVVRWVLDDKGIIEGFFIRPDASREAASEYSDYETKTDLRLPFKEAMTVAWGGRTVEENYHAAYPDQRFAYDFVVTRDGRSYEGDGDELEDYYCYGAPLVAPGAGTVVVAVDGLPDLAVGEMDPENANGNHIVIDHGNGEFSLLGHLMLDSVQVVEGDTVEAGQDVGACGNSGNTTEPHLHYQLQTNAEPYDTVSIPAQFQGYIADGERVERGEPVQNQVVSMP